MRRAVLLTMLLGLAAGCGGGGGGGGGGTPTTEPSTPAPPATSTAAGDPGKATIEAFVAAARRADASALWALLSSPSRERLGPTLERFRKGPAGELVEGVGSIGRFHTVVSERITPEFGVVAIDGMRTGERAVYAAALRLEGTRWRIELGGPTRVRPIGPDPDAKEPVVAQIAGAVEGPGGAGTAVMYLDGQAVNPEIRETATGSTLFANFDPALDPGRHTVVLFASEGREASAAAWAFTVGKAGPAP